MSKTNEQGGGAPSRRSERNRPHWTRGERRRALTRLHRDGRGRLGGESKADRRARIAKRAR